MASLKKRGKIYYAQYYVGGEAKRESLHTSSLQKAKVELAKLEKRLGGDFSDSPTKTPTKDVLTDYCAHLYANRTAENAKKVISVLRSVFGEICPALQIKNRKIEAKARAGKNKVDPIKAETFEEITTAAISTFIDSKMLHEGSGPKTANNIREILRRLFNWAVTQKGKRLPDGKNPAAAVDRKDVPDPDIVFLDHVQIEEQLKHLAKYPLFYVMVALYIFAGLRREEALWLTKKDIDLEAGEYGVIYIRKKKIKGKVWWPKNRKNRVVPISSRLRAILDQYVPADSDGDWFFPSPDGKRWDRDNFSSNLKEINDQHQPGLTWSCLDFRHTFGSQLAMKGESLLKISRLMGNSPEICEKHYINFCPSSLSRSVEFMPQPAAKESELPAENQERPRLRLVVNNT
jgi:integrase